jgi:TAT (twin-arginine translocation) pathway signal sequence
VTELNRRDFLGVAGAAGAGALTVSSPASSPKSFPAQERAMILQVAKAGAVFPIKFPSFGEPGPATARATAARLRGAARRLSASRLALARSGASLLIAEGLLNQPRARLLDGIGRLAGTESGERELTATVALAIGTVSRHFDPGRDQPASIWIDGLRILHQRGQLTAGSA